MGRKTRGLALVVSSVFVLSLVAAPAVAVAAESAPLPTPSATLPYDIGTNLGGMERFSSFSDSSYERPLVNPNDEDYATAEQRPWTFVTRTEFTNNYWENLTINGVSAFQTADMSYANATFSAEPNSSSPQLPPSDFNLTQTLIGGEASLPITTNDVGIVLPLGESVAVYSTVTLPRSNMEYTHENGKLAAYGYQFNYSVNMTGTSTDGREFVLEPSWGVNFVTPLFDDIRTGTSYDCSSAQANSEVCASTAAYGTNGRSSVGEFPPLESRPATTPTAEYAYARPACVVTSSATENGQTTMTARIDAVFEDTNPNAEHVFMSGEFNGVQLEDTTNGTVIPIDTGWGFIPEFDWSTVEGKSTRDAEGVQSPITYAGPDVTYAFPDTAAAGVRDLTFTMNMVIAQVEGAMYPMSCSTTTGEAPPVVVVPLVETVTPPVEAAPLVEVIPEVDVPITAVLAETGANVNIGLALAVTLSMLVGGALLLISSRRTSRS